MDCANRILDVFHHITLEFPKEKIHLTGYDTDGNKVRIGQSLGSVRYPNSTLAVCWIMLVKTDILRKQETMIQRKLCADSAQQQRLTEWFMAFLNSITRSESRLVPPNGEYDYIYYGIYLGPQSITKEQLPPDLLPIDVVRSEVDGFEPTPDCQISLTPFRVRDRALWIATACPPGRLRKPVVVRFPRRAS